jgi:YidC/Oxa1 family membrane protein insertase
MFFATNPFQPLINFFEAILVFFHDNVGLQWGTAIIALTLLVRSALLPLTLKQFKSMQAMARLQPEIKKLQERYKNDKERLNQEMMRFYRENKVNPFASCLPMVAQLPVFLSLYYMLRTDLRYDICPEINPPDSPNPQPCGNGGDAQFLFIPDLTNRATGYVLVILIVLYVGTQLASTLLMSTTTDRTQRMIFLALPFFFVLFVWQFPAGLLVYWITTNVWTIVQQAIVRRRLGPLRPPGQETESLGDMIRKLGGGDRQDDDGGAAKPAKRAPAAEKKPSGSRQKAAVASAESKASAEPKGRPSGPPPAPPRKKKKRSGRRR